MCLVQGCGSKRECLKLLDAAVAFTSEMHLILPRECIVIVNERVNALSASE